MDRRDLTDKIKYKPLRDTMDLVRILFLDALNFYGGALLYILRLLKVLPIPPAFSREKIKRIVIFRPDMIGDVVMATPVLKACRENFPQAYIALVVSPLTKDIVMKNPYLDELIVINGIGFLNLFKDFKIVRLIKEKNFDLALVLFPALSCNLLAFLSGIPQRIGYGDRGSKFLLTRPLFYGDFGKKGKHMTDVNMDLLRAIGCRIENEEMYISVYEDAQKTAAAFFETNNLGVGDTVIMLHPGARRAYQRWPVEKFSLLADKLIEELSAKVIFLSGPSDGDLARRAISMMRNKAVLAAGLSLKEMISLIKRCDLFIGHSTGTTHISDGLGTLTIMIGGFLGSGDSPLVWGTYDKRNITVFKDMGCKRCNVGTCRGYPCIATISVEDVFTAAKEQISKITKGKDK